MSGRDQPEGAGAHGLARGEVDGRGAGARRRRPPRRRRRVAVGLEAIRLGPVADDCASGKPDEEDEHAGRNAVHRQPRRVSPRTTTGVRSPPTGMPVELIDSASARWRRNQLTMATLIGR